MTDFWFVTNCNRPRLSDPVAVRAILSRYRFDWDLSVTVQHDAQGDVRLSFDGDGWPGAWPRSADDQEPDLSTDGIPGFEALLSEVCPYLAEPLIVQAIGRNQGRFPLSACEWQIHPSWQTIAKVEFVCSSLESPLLPATPSTSCAA